MAGDGRIVLQDADARRRAATDFATNLVVIAGAGTGKTSLLVERALNAIGAGLVTMDSIAAITFTEKAAGEMRERLATGLDRLRALAREGGELDDAVEADRAYRHLTDGLRVAPAVLETRSLEAMQRIDHGTVVTIHGFCAELLRAHPVEAGVDPGFVVDAGERAESLGGEIWDEFVRQELGPTGERAQTWERLLAQFTLAQVGAVARQLAGFAVPLAALDAAGADRALTALRSEARRIASDLDAGLARGDDLTPLGARCWRGLRDALELLLTADLATCRNFLLDDGELADRVESGRLGSTRKQAGPAAAEEAKRVADEARALCKGILQTDDDALDRLIGVVRPFVEDYRERYLRRGLVGFDGLLALARDLLRDRPDVRRRLKRRFSLLLVDEFQDTDPLQYEIVLFLAEQPDDEAADPFSARLAPGRLFVVGDAKQSIYRFRGADYAAYRRAVDRICEAGGVRLSLVGNFRSVPGVVDPLNDLFGGASGCWHESAYQPEYAPIQPVRSPAADPSSVDVWSVELPDGARAGDRRDAEGRVIAEAIANWVERDKKLKYEEITLLFRAFTNISHYLRPLRERGIPFVVDGGRDFLERPEVGQLIATLRAVSRPADPTSLLAFLRSPAGGASDVELARYAAQGGRWSWWEEPAAERFPNIAASFRVMRDLWSETRDLPVDRFVRRVLDRTRMLPLGAAAFEGPQRVANLQKLTAAAGELARDGTLSLDEVIEAIEEGRLEEIETDRPLADDAAEAVRVTNIHRMKGLENGVIVLPDLARRKWVGGSRGDGVGLAVLPDGDGALAIRAADVTNSARLWYELEDRRHGESEEVRVLYVALTRARERLVLVAAPSRGSSPWLRALESWGYEAENPPADGALLAEGRVRHRLRKPPPVRRPPERDLPEAATRATRAYDAAVAALGERARPPLAAPSGLREDRQALLSAGTGWVPQGTRQSRDLGKAAGIALHRLLERWDGRDRDRLSETLARLCAEAARETHVNRTELEREARKILAAFLEGDLADRFSQLDRLGAELPVLVQSPDAGQAFRGSIDLLYRDVNGEIVVADFKTDRATDPGTLRSSYGAQLAVYADAVRLALGLSELPRTELWMLRTGEIVPVSASGAGPTRPGGRE
jgi:ATP-dependent helicase/nuclease subunit A